MGPLELMRKITTLMHPQQQGLITNDTKVVISYASKSAPPLTNRYNLNFQVDNSNSWATLISEAHGQLAPSL